MSDSIFTALTNQIMSLWSQIYVFVCLISFFFVAYHFGKALMTYGDMQIQNGDKVIVFCLPEAITAVEHLFN